MNKKGFTMIELLAVIVILAVLLGVTTVSVFSIRKNQEEQNRENTISSILTGAKNFTAEHPSRKSKKNADNKIIITVQELIDGEYIDFDKENEKTKDLLGESIEIKQCRENPMKVKYVLKSYNDCGCDNQETSVGAVSDRICPEE